MSEGQNSEDSAESRYRGTDDRTGEALLGCEDCDRTWPEGRFEDGRCPDCQEAGR